MFEFKWQFSNLLQGIAGFSHANLAGDCNSISAIKVNVIPANSGFLKAIKIKTNTFYLKAIKISMNLFKCH